MDSVTTQRCTLYYFLSIVFLGNKAGMETKRKPERKKLLNDTQKIFSHEFALPVYIQAQTHTEMRNRLLFHIIFLCVFNK